MTPASTLAMLLLTGVVIAACMVFVIRFDVEARAGRYRFERHVRRGAARLLREADWVRRTGS